MLLCSLKHGSLWSQPLAIIYISAYGTSWPKCLTPYFVILVTAGRFWAFALGVEALLWYLIGCKVTVCITSSFHMFSWLILLIAQIHWEIDSISALLFTNYSPCPLDEKGWDSSLAASILALVCLDLIFAMVIGEETDSKRLSVEQNISNVHKLKVNTIPWVFLNLSAFYSRSSLCWKMKPANDILMLEENI